MKQMRLLAVTGPLVISLLVGCGSSSMRLASLPSGCVGMMCERSRRGPECSEAAKEQPQPDEEDAVKPADGSTRCETMGSASDAAEIADSSVRGFQGQNVAFGCPSCPQAWDTLTDAEREAKLRQAGLSKRRVRKRRPRHAPGKAGHI